MQIRSANKNDAREIANIIKKHFEEDYMGFASFDEKYIKEKMKKDEFFVAADNGIRGCLRISFVDVDLAEIRALCVDKEFRKKGIAQMLLDVSIKSMKEKSMRKIIARTKADNSDAIKFFENNKFLQEGYFKEHYRKDIDVVQLYRFL